jgi:hypothetical protein
MGVHALRVTGIVALLKVSRRKLRVVSASGPAYQCAGGAAYGRTRAHLTTERAQRGSESGTNRGTYYSSANRVVRRGLSAGRPAGSIRGKLSANRVFLLENGKVLAGARKCHDPGARRRCHRAGAQGQNRRSCNRETCVQHDLHPFSRLRAVAAIRFLPPWEGLSSA